MKVNLLPAVMTLFLMSAAGVAVGANWAEGDLKTITLWRGCTADVAWVTISLNGSELVVTFGVYTSDPDEWMLTETQLYLANLPPTSCDYSTFPYIHTGLGDSDGVETDEYRIGLASLNLEPGDTLYFAAHAMIVNFQDKGEEAWAFDEDFTLIADGCDCGKYCSLHTFSEGELPDTGWPMHRHDLERCGYTASEGPAKNFTLWTFETGHNVFSCPAVTKSRIYFGSRDYNFYCLNSTSGAHLWNFTARSTPHSPAVAAGLVYFGSSDFSVYCLNATTGELVWEFGTGYYVDACPAVHGGRVYIGSMDNHFYCLDAYTGALIWRFEAKDSFDDSAAALHDGKVYVGCTDNRLLCLDAMSGDLLWEYETDGGIHSSPALCEGKVYFGSMDGNVYCLSAPEGTLIWNYTTGYWVLSSPAVAGGRLYIGSHDGQAYCLNATTGAPIWQYNTGMEMTASPAIANETVYFASNDGWIRCLDTKTGALIWYYDSRAASYSSPAIADGRLYIGSFDHRVHAIGSQSLSFGTDTGDFVSVSSNSGVSGFNLDDPERSFGLTTIGTPGTPAFVNITFAKGLIDGEPALYHDGSLIKSIISSNTTHTSIYAEFPGGVHEIRVSASDIPEAISLHGPIMTAVAALALMMAQRRRWKMKPDPRDH